MAGAGLLYGSSLLTRRKYWLAQLALACGTALEWYDFGTFTVLEPVMAPLFFPKTVDAATAAQGARGAGASATVQTQVQFWAVFSLTFIARPFGGVLFAAIADLRGRKSALLASVACMGVVSLLIGCLPTAAQVGVAAPVLLCLLRFCQGLALGGEFAAALVAAFELAPAKGKNLAGAFAFIASTLGTMLGIIVPLIVLTAMQDNTPALMLWGWRVPFLLSVLAAAVALGLRTMMVEPDVILEAIERDRRAVAALDRADEAEEAAEARAAAAGLAEDGGAAAAAPGAAPAAAAAGAVGATSAAAAAAATAAAVHHRRPASHAGAPPLPPAAAEAVNSATPLRAGGGSMVELTTSGPSAAAVVAAGGGGGALGGNGGAAVGAPHALPPHHPHHPHAHPHHRRRRRHHRAFPLVPVLRHHWRKALLQCCYTAMGTGTSVVYTGWLGLSLLAPPASLPRPLAYGAGLVALGMSAIAGLSMARFLLDAGRVRPLHLSLFGILLSIVVAPVVFMVAMPGLVGVAATPGGRAGYVLVLAACVSQASFLFCSLSASMSRLYPPNLRVSGFSLAHNVATSVFGGLSPILLTALQQRAPRVGPAAYMASVSALSAVACVLLMRLYPRTNMLPHEVAEAEARDAAAEGAAAAAAAGGGGGGEGGGGAAGDRREPMDAAKVTPVAAVI